MSVWGRGCWSQHTGKGMSLSLFIVASALIVNIFFTAHDAVLTYILCMALLFQNVLLILQHSVQKVSCNSCSLLYADWLLSLSAVRHAAWCPWSFNGQLHQCERGSCRAAGQVCAQQTPTHWAILRHAHREDTGKLSSQSLIPSYAVVCI